MLYLNYIFLNFSLNLVDLASLNLSNFVLQSKEFLKDKRTKALSCLKKTKVYVVHNTSGMLVSALNVTALNNRDAQLVNRNANNAKGTLRFRSH